MLNEVYYPTIDRQAKVVPAGGHVAHPGVSRISAALNRRRVADGARRTFDAHGVGEEFVDVPVSAGQQAPIRFTVYWTGVERWEGGDFQVAIRAKQ